MQFINQNSFLLAAVLSLTVLAVILLRRGLRGSDVVALGALVLGFTLAFLLLRPPATAAANAAAVRAQIGAGTPVLLELQSPY